MRYSSRYNIQAHTIIVILMLILSQTSCVPKYRRSIEGSYSGYNSSKLFVVFDSFLKDKGFVFKGTAEKPEAYDLVSFYSIFDHSVQHDITIVIFFKDIVIKHQEIGSDFLVTVNGVGSDKAIEKAVDKQFEVVVTGLLSTLEKSKLKITKKS